VQCEDNISDTFYVISLASCAYTLQCVSQNNRQNTDFKAADGKQPRGMGSDRIVKADTHQPFVRPTYGPRTNG